MAGAWDWLELLVFGEECRVEDGESGCECAPEAIEHMGCRDQERGGGVAEDMFDLPWPQGFVDHDGDSAGGGGTEEGGGGVGTPFEEDGDAVTRPDTGVREHGGEGAGTGAQFVVGAGAAALEDSGGRAPGCGGVPE